VAAPDMLELGLWGTPVVAIPHGDLPQVGMIFHSELSEA
jgi:hypothetical protein